MILFKSRLYREEFLRWGLMLALLAWGLTSTLWAASKSREVVLIGFDDNGARLVTDAKDRLLQEEAAKLIRSFVSSYLNFEASTHQAQIGKAADLMSAELWGRLQSKLLEVNRRLQSEPLSQIAEVESIDMTGEGVFEVLAAVRIKQRATTSIARVKLTIELGAKERTPGNPWAFEIKELRDEVL